MAIQYNDFENAVTKDKYNQFFLTAAAAKAKTAEVNAELDTEKNNDTYDWINTTLEGLIVDAIQKGQKQIQITVPSTLNKDLVISALNATEAGYGVTTMTNGGLIISWAD
jgi:hypothetical protein